MTHTLTSTPPLFGPYSGHIQTGISFLISTPAPNPFAWGISPLSFPDCSGSTLDSCWEKGPEIFDVFSGFFCLNTGASTIIQVLIDPSAGSAQLSVPEALFILTSCKLLYSPVSIEMCLHVQKTAFKFQFMRTFHLWVPVWGVRLQCWVTKAAPGRLWMKWPDLKRFSHGILTFSNPRGLTAFLKSSALKTPSQQIMQEGSFSKQRCVIIFLCPNYTGSLSAWHKTHKKSLFPLRVSLNAE